MSGSCCACAFTDTPFLTDSCGAGFTLLMGLIQLMLSSQCDVADPCNRAGADNFRLDDAALHDFIVVGAGAAGSVIAARLAERPGNTVLLLEAGPEEPSATLLPAFAVSAVGSSLDWGYTTTAQAHACLGSDGVCSWPRGKMVSGTSGMQGMMYTRGHPSIYDGWAVDGWTYDQVLPYFLRAENYQDVELGDEGYHGFEGPLVVGKFPHHPPLADAVVQAGVELGYRQGDLNGRNQTGFAVAPMMVSDGLRGSTARLYLRTAAAQTQRLNVSINSHVTRVLFDAQKRAVGVEFIDQDGNNKTALARKEVILSAGAVGSPHLLLLSGVGPAPHLAELGIPLVADLPVGDNLQNHVSTSVTFTVNDTALQMLTLEALDEFLRTRSGPMAGTGLTQTTGFMRSALAQDDVPDLQVFFDGFNAGCSRTGLAEECTDGSVGACARRFINSRPTVILPRSRGTLRLRTTNPFDQPAMDPGYFTDPRDVDVLVDGVRQVQALTRTDALKAWDFQLLPSPSSGCEGETFDSDAYWACHVRRHTGAENHQGGTCRMATDATDADAVVDASLRVIGVAGLRVVDASVFPTMPNANPIAAIVMAAEKCADLLAQDWPLDA